MLQASPAGILTILGLNLLPSEVTSRRVSQEEQRDFIGTAMHICLLTNASRVQMAGDAAGHAQLDRLQAQNSTLQKLSRKLQEEVRCLRAGDSAPSTAAGNGTDAAVQQEPMDDGPATPAS